MLIVTSDTSSRRFSSQVNGMPLPRLVVFLFLNIMFVNSVLIPVICFKFNKNYRFVAQSILPYTFERQSSIYLPQQGNGLRPRATTNMTSHFVTANLRLVEFKSCISPGFMLTPRRSSRNPEKVITDLVFADDIALTSGNVDRAQRLLSRVENEGNRVGLLLSEKKTKVMTCNVAPDPILTNGGIALEEVEDFKYLGSWVNSSERDIKTRKAIAWKALNSMKRVWKSNVSNELKTRLFIATVESVLLYGCESWTFTSALERSLDGCYTRMLRAALNISWQSFVPNEELYGTLPRISDKVAWRRLGLAGHCFRHKELLAGELVLWEPTHGRRGRGRPSATFIDTLKRDLGTDDKLELEVCMTNQEDWRARRVARLRPP